METELEEQNITWPKQKTGTSGVPVSMAIRTNPFLL